MSKKLQLHIPLPCNEDWNKMTAAEKGKFCTSCQKTVIDFTAMSDAQIISFFKRPATGSVCGRFQEYQLNRDMQLPRKQLPWIKYFFQFALPAFLISIKADAQQPRLTGKVTVCVNDIKGDTLIKTMPGVLPATITIEGKVIDDEGMPISYASVVIKGTQRGVATDSTGFFSLKILQSDNSITLVVSCVGFQSYERVVNVHESAPGGMITRQVQLEKQVMGEVIVAGGVSVKGRVTGLTSVVRTTNYFKKDSVISVFKKFSLYPNPIVSGHSVTLENRKLPDDNYAIEIINQAGQIVHQEQTMINGKQKISLNMPVVPAGAYFIRLNGKKSLKTWSEQIIIQ